MGDDARIVSGKLFFYALFVAIFFLLLSPPPVSSDDAAISMSGHYSNLLIHSRTLVNEDYYYLDSSRLRIEAKGEPGAFFSYNVQYDNTVAFGDYIATNEFLALEAGADQIPRRTFLDLEDEISAKNRLRWTHSLHRGYVRIRGDHVDVTLGRQRIAWGRGWFFSPLDIFNPLSPTAIEREERAGVDGALVELSSDIVSRGSALYLPMKDGSDTLAARAETLIGSYDTSLAIGRHGGADFAGTDFTGYLGDAGFKGELVFSRQDDADKINWLLAGNYRFENTLTIMVEYFHNDGGTLHPVSYGGQDYIGLDLGYDLTPLTRFEYLVVINLSDGSGFYSPILTSSLDENCDLNLGMQYFTGEGSDEYGRLKNLVYARFSVYF